MTTIQDTADMFMASGIAVIPVMYREKKPSIPWSCFRGGIPGSRLPTQTELDSWFAGFSNLGVCCGWRQLHVLDFDNSDEYGRWGRWCEKQGGLARFVAHTAYRVRTCRGVHVYLRTRNSVKHIAVKDRFDVQGNGRFVVGAGSLHPSGVKYVVLHDGLFPFVEHISDVLPAAALVQSEQQFTKVPVAPLGNVDPWEEAMHAGEPGAGLVERIKSTWKIESFFTDTVQTGENYLMTWCPFHDDDGTRSMWVDTGRQICGCFAGCTSKAIDVIGLFGRLHGLDNRNAIFEMARRS